MIDLRNRQYATILDCVAGENLEQGQVITLVPDATNTGLKAVKATSVDDLEIWGPLFAYWINDRSTAIAYRGGEDGLTFPLAQSSDPDAVHYIPSGARMLAIGGIGVTEIRFFKDSLHASISGSMPNPGTVLGFSATDNKLCPTNDGTAVSGARVARVTEKDAVSITVIIG